MLILRVVGVSFHDLVETLHFLLSVQHQSLYFLVLTVEVLVLRQVHLQVLQFLAEVLYPSLRIDERLVDSVKFLLCPVKLNLSFSYLLVCFIELLPRHAFATLVLGSFEVSLDLCLTLQQLL
jgi:TRAP-type uncharacterized transport system fused permease subunit